MEPAIIVALITAAGALMGVIVMKLKKNDWQMIQDDRIMDLQLAIATMKGRQEAENEIREINLIKAFHSPHLKTLDGLLQKVKTDIEDKTDTITLDELKEARTRLDAELQNIKDRDEPNAKVASLGGVNLLSMIDIRILEKEQ